MEDMIFGTLATDDLKLYYHRASSNGLQHASKIDPLDPHPGEPVTITVDLGPEVYADQVACYYTVDGSDPAGSRGSASVGKVLILERVKIKWDTFSWGYSSRWQGQLPGVPDGTKVQYRISAWSNGGREIFADWPDVQREVEVAAKAFFHDQPFPDGALDKDRSQGHLFAYHVDQFKPPSWAREAIIYHIFLDRFCPGQDRDWKQTSDLKGLFGGTLWGVAEKMDYISELGATAIWLSPIFSSPTVHGYDATDYYTVEERLGGEPALREVITQAHKRGIRIILDLVCNHTSHLHPYFQEALTDQNSPYHDWFFFDKDEDHGYRSFFGVHSMPQVNLNHPDARQWMLEIARYWLEEYEVDGYRLDFANGPNLDFWSDFWALTKKVNPDSFCFAEVVETPGVLEKYQGRVDGVLDFHIADAIRRTYGRKVWDENRFKSMANQHLAYFQKDFVLPSFLDNHDMDRFRFIADNDEDSLMKAAEVQFRLPGPPVIYYGTEVGVPQTVSKTSEVGLEASRGAMLWGDDQNRSLLGFYQNLIKERKQGKPWENETFTY